MKKISNIFKKRETNFDDPSRGFEGVTKTVLIIALAVLIVLSAALYTYIGYKNGSLKNFFMGEENSTTESTTTKYSAPEISGGTNLLVSVTSDGGTSGELFFVVGFDMNKRAINCISVPKQTFVSGNRTLEECFAVGASAQVLIGIQDAFSINVDRYIQFTKSDFIKFINEFAGKIDVDLDEGIRHSTADYSLNLQTGPNSLKAEDFVNLLRYDGWSEGIESTCSHRASYLLNAVKSILNVSFYEGGSDRFSELIEYADDTNMSVEDYEELADGIGVLAHTAWRANDVEVTGKSVAGSFKVSAECVNSVKSLFTVSGNE